MKDYKIEITKGEKSLIVQITEEMIKDVPSFLDYIWFSAQRHFDNEDISGIIKVSPDALKDFDEVEYDHLKELSKKKIY